MFKDIAFKRTPLKTIVLTASVFISVNAHAAGYTGPAKVSWMSSFGTSQHVSEVGGTWANPDNCSSPSKFTIGYLSEDDDFNRQSKHAMIQSALLSGQTVEFYVDGCNQYGQPRIKGVYIPARNPS